MQDGRYIGLMSGTSMDGIDSALVEITQASLTLVAFVATTYARPLRNALTALVGAEHAPLESIGRLHVEIGQAFAAAASAVLEESGLNARDVVAIGSHGQTVLHKPEANPPFSLQLGDASVIAFRTGITTVADFRAKDIAAGGQGAPLVPAFHQFAFGAHSPGAHAVLNLGGISNLTIFKSPSEVSGFDCGPGNTLMDIWIERCRGLEFDRDGCWARSGKVNSGLLHAMLTDSFFARTGPKSSGRDYFNLRWLNRHLARFRDIAEVDVQTTLAELTARTTSEALRRHLGQCLQLAVCGGGAENAYLLERLAALLPGTRILTTTELGIPPRAVEACAFAWLAACRLAAVPGNIPTATGAPAPLILGAIHHPS